MSNAVASNLRIMPVVNKNMQYHNSGKYGIKLGNRQYTPTRISTTAAVSGGIATFIATPPSTMTGLDRDVRIKWFFQIDFTCTINNPGGGNYPALNIGLFDAPRACPATQCMTSISVTLNSTSITLNINQLLNAFLRANMDNEDLSMKLALAPSALDQFQNYNDGYTTPPATTGGQFVSNLNGAVSDPLQSFGQGKGNYQANRGSWPINVISNNTGPTGSSRTASIQFTSMEPLWCPPFDASCEENFSLIGLTNFGVSCNFGKMDRIWSHNADHPNSTTITNMVVTFFQQPEIHLTWLTPHTSVVIPNITVYPYSTVQQNQTDSKLGVVANEVFTVTSNNLNLSIIPELIYVYAERRMSDKTVNTSDVFAEMIGVNLIWDNASGQLAQSSEEDAYLQSLKNGMKINWIEYRSAVGTVYLLQTTKNLVLTNPAEAPGVSSNKQFQIQATFRNINQGAPMNFSMWVNVITTGLLTIENNQAVTQTGVVSETDVLNAASDLSNAQVNEPSKSFYGGRIGRLGEMLGSVHRTLQKYRPISRGIAAAQQLGYNPNPAFGVAARMAGYGGSFFGGKSISHEELGKRGYERISDVTEDNNNNNNNQDYQEEEEEEEQQY
jgi:hypothetical protein